MGIEVTIAIVSITVANIIGWIVTLKKESFNYGQLTQKVEDMDDTINNGLCEKVDSISRHVAMLEGKVDIYIELHSRIDRKDKDE